MKKLYVSSGGGFKSTLGVDEIVADVNANLELPAPAADVRGGIFTGPGITDATATIPAAAPAGGTGTAAGAWDTAPNRDAAIATINGLRTAVQELQTKFNALKSSLEGTGVIA